MKVRGTKLFAMFCLFALTTGIASRSALNSPPSVKPIEAHWRLIVRVLDGDTVRLDNGDTIRLLGVDTPESSANRKLKKDLEKLQVSDALEEMTRLGKFAADFSRSYAEGRRCWVEYDKNARDRYGRLLGYIHIYRRGILNEALIANGYGRAYVEYPFKYKRRYIDLQREAQKEKRGLWSVDTGE